MHSSKKMENSPITPRFIFLSEDCYPPFRADIRVLFGDVLRKAGYKIDWVLPSEKPSKAHNTFWKGGRVFVGARKGGTSKWDKIIKHLQRFVHYCKVFYIVKDYNYDFIQVKDLFLSAFPAIFASRTSRVPLIYWLSYPFPEAQIQRFRDGTANYPLISLCRGLFFSFILYHVIFPMAKHIFVQSEQMMRDLIAKGVAESKMTPVPMGVNDNSVGDLMDLNEAAMIESDQERRILYLGTLVGIRRLEFLVRVLRIVKKYDSRAVLIFVGKGESPEDEAKIIDEARRLGLENKVRITGFIPFKKAMEHVRRAHVCVSPFFPTPVLKSTSPTKMIEYMAMARPVVANEHPEQRIIIEQSKCGFCVPWNEKAFADAILSLFADPDLSRAMGNKGRKWVMANRVYSIIGADLDTKYRTLTTD